MTTTTSISTSNPPSNPRDYVKSPDPAEVESTLTRFQEMISKYQFMSQNVERRAAGLREKLPEMRKSLDTVRFLRMRKGKASRDSGAEQDEGGDGDGLEEGSADANGMIETTYALQDTLYAHATVNTQELDSVYLWLGANVMVAYPLDEAESMLKEKLDKAKESLKAAEEDLEFIRVQTTTLEVATARVHNWDVGEKRKKKESG
ncbi:hypothetical protein LTR70_003248 [Exophiala xenobiotica]|uniref:Prefoldin subunit 3 n=1 Tax=Lithohypha guttulata TaxID=1690604 RepID=A0ABR0JWF2_9EURO|nr:hypothetical protein LTR24_009756 [Lithohypha guttulata]KAK5323760.1 hypothetical protein LTR70_003248 [Exophiala xenobiotica]